MISSAPDNSTHSDTSSLPSFPPRRAVGSSVGLHQSVDVVGSFRRHWIFSLFVFLVILGGGAFVLWKKAKPDYKSQSVVYISPKFPKVLNSDSEVDLPYDSYFQDQIQTVTRYDIISDAIEQLPYSVRHRGGPALPVEIQKLQRTLDVKRVGTSYEMSIGLNGSSPNGLAEIVNAVTNAYVERAKNEEFFGLDDRLNTLHQERDRLQKEMAGRLAEQAQLMQELGVATISSKEGTTNPFDSTSETVRSELDTARMQREAAEAQLAAVLTESNSAGQSPPDTAADTAITTDPSLFGTWGNLNTRRDTLMEEISGLRPENPIYQKDKQEVASIDNLMNDLRRKANQQLQSKLRQDVERTRLVELKLTQELAEQTHTATSAAPKFQRASELGPEIENLQKTYEAIDDRIRDLELESSSPGSIHVATKALTPGSPEPSKLPLYTLALLLMGLACAASAPVGIDLLDNRIYTSHDIERVVGFHPIGVLLDEDEFPEKISGEYYFRLAAGIDHAVRTSGARTFLLTSPAHGGGTTTVVRKLSDELRVLNLRTKIIKAVEFGELEVTPSSASSLSELFLQKWNKPDEIRHTPLTAASAACGNLRFHIEREAPPSNSVERTLHHASLGYDVVLIDASPLPISANTEYLARVTDATVLVVKASTTTRQELHRAARLLERLEVAGVAVILNKMSLGRADRALSKEFRSYEQSLNNHPSVSPKAAPQQTRNSA